MNLSVAMNIGCVYLVTSVSEELILLFSLFEIVNWDCFHCIYKILFKVQKPPPGPRPPKQIARLSIKGEKDFGDTIHTASSETYFHDSAYQQVQRHTANLLINVEGALLQTGLALR